MEDIHMLERDVEKRLITQLKMMGYQEVQFSDTFTMEDNIRECLNKVFKKDYTAEEIKKILRMIQSETDKTMQYAYGFNEILDKGLYLQLRSGERLSKENSPYIKLIDKTMANHNIFQVAHQITDKGNKYSRYDVTLLINGFPIVQIELKQASVELDEAVNQINRYINTAFTGLFKYVQLFVISNDTETKYGINTNSNINKLFMFNWSDENNTPLHSLTKFTDSFFEIHNLFDMITKYIIRYGTGDKKMIVLRPYQVHAIKSVIKKVTIPENAKVGRNMNGYVFHTTGSGKTITSWKCVQMISELPDVAKVVFLVDRRDLDVQTTSEFKAIDSNLDIEDTKNTSKLMKAFRDKKAIITTIQKMSRAIDKADPNSDHYDKQYEAVFTPYKNKRVVFIIDECHRTQYGSMHMSIERFFKNSLYIGFTGTPIYEENMAVGSMTTKQLFGAEVHKYKIKDAIQDKNVLGFSVDYYNTVYGNKYFGIMTSNDTEALAKEIDRDEVIMNPTRITSVVKEIFKIHDKKTQNRKYTALFAVQSINMLMAYYDEFKKQNEAIENPGERLKISAIFTANDTETQQQELDQTKSAKYKEIVKDFNAMCGTNCSYDADKNDTFRAELVKGLRKEREYIDIVLVVGIFLTGFDSKMTNTLYVDKRFEFHTLLQAFSRTNRVESASKPFGNIVCFRNLKAEVDEAIALFNYGSDSDIVAKSYESVLKDLEQAIDEINRIVPKDFVMTNKSESEKKEFVEGMRELNKQLNQAKQFVEFSWDSLKGKLTEDNYNALIGQFKEIKNETDDPDNKSSVLKYIDFCMELVEQDKIDLDYIKRLITNIDLSSFESIEHSANEIKKIVDKSNSDTLKNKKDLIKKFLDTLILESKNGSTLKDSTELVVHFKQFVQREQINDKVDMAGRTNISADELDEELLAFSVTNKVNKARIDSKIRANNTKATISIRSKIGKVLYNFVKTFNSKFDGLI